MIRDEIKRVMDWEERHRRLVARLALVLMLTVVVDAVGTALVYLFEHGVRGGEIRTVWDAFFFTTVQLLTVSSQIRNPLTVGGRVVDIVLEVWAVVVVAGSAGALATFFQSADG